MENTNNVTVTLTGKTINDVVTNAQNFINSIGKMGTTTTTTTTTRGRKPKVKEETFGDDEDTDSEMEMSDEEMDSETETDDADVSDDEETDGPTLKDVTNALKKYAAKSTKHAEKAKAILKQFKVKHVDDLPESSYAKVMKSLT